ncbi:hypothetical protein EDD17DRAFT_1829712 [Pisolithus thermaeus]|nr:hypothetical protein EV401DRAFT_1895154 [Pisolithus croceorrhizus]KAI6168254.1 hypothetical protein EDD17DRAFT_1829712 [Pisolithus thermaeus]
MWLPLQWYYDHMYVEKTLSLYNSLVKECFPVLFIVPTIFSIYQNLLGVTFMEMTGKKKRHLASQSSREPRDHTKLWTEMWERISHVKSGELKPGWGSFSYIVRGYDAGYYGYTYLLVFTAEMYITVLKWGPLDPIIGQLYRSKILLSGGSRDEVVSLEASCHRYGDEVDFLCWPPIDAIWESIVMSLETYIGPEGNLLEMKPDQCHRISCHHLYLPIEEKNAMKNLKHVYPTWPSVTIDITFPKEGLPGYQLALQHVCSGAAQAIEDGVKVIILPDHATGPTCVPLSVLVACGGVHHCLLIMETICKIGQENLIKSIMTVDELTTHYHHSTDHAILTVMSRWGAMFDLLALDMFELHECGWPMWGTILPHGIPESDKYHWRDGGDAHINDPGGIASLKDAVRKKNQTVYDVYALNANEQVKSIHLCGLLDFHYENATPIPIEQVEPWNEIILSRAHNGFLEGWLPNPESLHQLNAMRDTGRYSYMIDGGVLLIVGILHEQDTHKLLGWCHPHGIFQSTLLCVLLPMLRNRERSYSWRCPLLIRCPSHLALHFRNYLSTADLDDLNIEII